MRILSCCFAFSVLLVASPLQAETLVKEFDISAPSGLGALVTFTLDTAEPTELEVRVKNTSTGVPDDFDAADQILTSVSWDFGLPGNNPGEPEITADTRVYIGESSESVNFMIGPNPQWFGAGTDVSREYGYANDNGGLLLSNLVTVNAAHATQLPGENRTGPDWLAGPQAGVIADPPATDLGGQAAIQDEIIIDVRLTSGLTNLDFLTDNGIIVEFGSDASFVPEPSALTLLGMGVFGLAIYVRRGRRCR